MSLPTHESDCFCSMCNAHDMAQKRRVGVLDSSDRHEARIQEAIRQEALEQNREDDWCRTHQLRE